MAYTTIDDPSLFHDTLIWTGDGATSRDISGLSFQPDWIWFKRRKGWNAIEYSFNRIKIWSWK